MTDSPDNDLETEKLDAFAVDLDATTSDILDGTAYCLGD